MRPLVCASKLALSLALVRRPRALGLIVSAVLAMGLVRYTLTGPCSLDCRLIRSVRVGDIAGVRRALQLGASPDAWTSDACDWPWDGPRPGEGIPLTALILAVQWNSAPMVRALLQAGADPNRWFEEDRPPLSHALEAIKPEIVHMLLDAGADPRADHPDPNRERVRDYESGSVSAVRRRLRRVRLAWPSEAPRPEPQRRTER